MGMDMFYSTAFQILLFGVSLVMHLTAWRYPSYRARLREKNLIAQIRVKEGPGRYFIFKDGKLTSRAGIHENADVVVGFKSARLALSVILRPNDQLGRINAAKTFSMTLDGPQEKALWFMFTLELFQTIGWKYGVDAGNGETRYCNMANGGPLSVYVKDGKIVRVTPIIFDDKDPQPWSIKAKGKIFTPPRRTSLAPHGQNVKSTIYSPDRIKHPMKRVDFDPNGERNPEKRGISGYERISWDEALDIVANEIKRQKTIHGPGSIACSHPSHHAWGNIGYYLSALRKFENAVGMTEVHHNPDSWEGWYWGAAHHWGGSLRVGQCESYGTVEDCLKDAEMMVLWSSNPCDRLCLDKRESVRQGLCRQPHARLRQMGRLCDGRIRRRSEVTRMAGSGNKRTGKRCQGFGQRMGNKENLSGRGRMGHGPWRRLPKRNRHSMGAHHGLFDRDAGFGKARSQYGQFAMGHSAGF